MRLVSSLALVFGTLTTITAADPLWTPFVSIGYAPSVSTVNQNDFQDKGAASLAIGESIHHPYRGDWGCTAQVAIFDTYGHADGDAAGVSGVEVKTNNLGLQVGMGPTYQAMPDLLLAVVPYVGLAWARYDYSGGGAASTDNGVALLYGVKLAACYDLHNHLTVGLAVGLEGTSTRLKDDASDSKYTATGAGPVVNVMVGWAF